MDKVLALQVTGELEVQIPKPTQSQAGVAAPCKGGRYRNGFPEQDGIGDLWIQRDDLPQLIKCRVIEEQVRPPHACTCKHACNMHMQKCNINSGTI